MIRALVIVLVLALPAWAEFTPDPRFEEADKLIQESRYVKARELGEQMLKENPNSFEAQTVLGKVHLYGEGNPGKADYYLRKAHKSITRQYLAPSTASGPWRCYGDTLWSLRNAAMDLENYEDALKWVDEFNQAFPPGAPELYGWPLMKLGRMEEARSVITEAVKAAEDDPAAVNNMLNTLGAIEYEAGNFQKSLDVCEKIIERLEAGKGESDAVFYSNAAESARDLLDLPAAEKHLLKSTELLEGSSYSTPWLDLAELYIAQGRQPEALQALQRHSGHLASCLPSVQHQKQALSQRVVGMALMACGQDSRACDLLRKVALHGDRNSGTSTKRELVRSRNHFFYREALRQKRERLRETRSYGSGAEWFKLYWEELALGREMEAARRECAALALKHDGPRAMLTPYGPNGFNCPWLTPALWQIFGRGVVAVEAAQVLKEAPEQSRPYVKAILAEAEGDGEMILESLEELPASQVLLRGRLQALLARETGSAERLQQALESDPPVIRRLSMSLPVAIECSDDELGDMIEASPRFHAGEGFRLTIDGTVGSGFGGQLLGPDGSVLARFEAQGGEDGRRLLCEELHQTVFAPKVNLSQADINGLDGSNLAGGRFREQLQELVGTSEVEPTP